MTGHAFGIETPDGQVSAVELGEGRTTLLLHSFNAAGCGAELAPLAERLGMGRRVVLVDWLGFGTSERPNVQYGPALYGRELEAIRRAVLSPDEAQVDVVALSLPAQYVAVAAAEHPERYRRLAFISATGLGRFKGNGDGLRPRLINGVLRRTGIGWLVFGVLARRRIIRWFLRQIYANPSRITRAYEDYCWLTCQQPGAYRAPVAFVSGRLNDRLAEDAYRRLAIPSLMLFGDAPRFTDLAAAASVVAANPHLASATIADAGDLPQLEQPDRTAAAIAAFLDGDGRA